MEFEWDDTKAENNLKKHGVSFEVVWSLDWGAAETRPDDRHDYGEERWRSLHVTEEGKRYVVVFVVRQGAYRIISVRRAHLSEVVEWAKSRR